MVDINLHFEIVDAFEQLRRTIDKIKHPTESYLEYIDLSLLHMFSACTPSVYDGKAFDYFREHAPFAVKFF